MKKVSKDGVITYITNKYDVVRKFNSMLSSYRRYKRITIIKKIFNL